MNRSELPDSVFGIPELRKYPMQDREHVLSAIKFFNYVDKEYEEELAKNIIKNIKKYNIPFDTVGDKNRLKKYIPKKYLEERSAISTTVRNIKTQKKIQDYYKKMGTTGPNGYADLIKRYKGYNAGLISVVNKETDLEYLKYIRSDTRSTIDTINLIIPRLEKCIRLGECRETRAFYKGIYKQYISKGVTPKDCEIAIKGVQKMIDEINDRIKVVRKMIKDGSIKEDATANAIVGTNQPDSVYIINYMKRNSFSGELEDHKGICKNDMKNIHIFNNAKKKMDPISLDEFTHMIEGDITIIKTPCTDFMNIIENAAGESDIDYLISSNIDYTLESVNMSTPCEEPNLIQEIQIYVDAEKQALSEHRYNHLCELPVLESCRIGNSCNYYTDINGYFIKNEITGLRSASYNDIKEIPSSVIERIKLS